MCNGTAFTCGQSPLGKFVVSQQRQRFNHHFYSQVESDDEEDFEHEMFFKNKVPGGGAQNIESEVLPVSSQMQATNMLANPALKKLAEWSFTLQEFRGCLTLRNVMRNLVCLGPNESLPEVPESNIERLHATSTRNNWSEFQNVGPCPEESGPSVLP